MGKTCISTCATYRTAAQEEACCNIRDQCGNQEDWPSDREEGGFLEVAGKPSHGMIEALHGTLNSCVCLLLQSTHIAAQTMRKSNAGPLALGVRNWRLWTSGARSAHPCPCLASLVYTRDTTLLPIPLAAARTRPSTAGRSIAPTPSFGQDSRQRDSKERASPAAAGEQADSAACTEGRRREPTGGKC